MNWNLADAQNRLGDVAHLALTEGPQTITLDDGVVVVLLAQRVEQPQEAHVVSKNDLFPPHGPDEVSLEAAEGPDDEEPDFLAHLLRAQGLDELDLSRDRSPGRDVEF